MSKIQRVYYLLYVDCIEQSLTIWDWHCSVIIFNGLPNGPTDKNVLLMRKFRSENDSWLRGFCVILTDILSFQLSWASDQNYVNYRILFNIKPDIRILFIPYKSDHTNSVSERRRHHLIQFEGWVVWKLYLAAALPKNALTAP